MGGEGIGTLRVRSGLGGSGGRVTDRRGGGGAGTGGGAIIESSSVSCVALVLALAAAPFPLAGSGTPGTSGTVDGSDADIEPVEGSGTPGTVGTSVVVSGCETKPPGASNVGKSECCMCRVEGECVRV